jgi:hypothetical protein
MNCSRWFVTKWQDATVGIEAVVNTSKFFEITSNTMWFA